MSNSFDTTEKKKEVLSLKTKDFVHLCEQIDHAKILLKKISAHIDIETLKGFEKRENQIKYFKELEKANEIKEKIQNYYNYH